MAPMAGHFGLHIPLAKKPRLPDDIQAVLRRLNLTLILVR